jgi:hypothetical protein
MIDMENAIKGHPEPTPLEAAPSALSASRRTLALQPDVILPIQFLRKRNLPARGERALMVAVLEEAILCFQKNVLGRTTRQRRLFREAEEWLMSDDRSGLYTFGRICDIAGLEPDYIRRGLLQWRERELLRALGIESALTPANGHPSKHVDPVREVA